MSSLAAAALKDSGQAVRGGSLQGICVPGVRRAYMSTQDVTAGRSWRERRAAQLDGEGGGRVVVQLRGRAGEGGVVARGAPQGILSEWERTGRATLFLGAGVQLLHLCSRSSRCRDVPGMEMISV